MFNCSIGALFISKYLLFIDYIQNTLTVNFHTIFTILQLYITTFTIVITNDHRGVTGETVASHI